MTSQRWAIYDASGALAIEPDSFISFDTKNDAKVPDYPMEKGAFSSYNKVMSPFEIHLRLSCGGVKTSPSDFLSTLADMQASVGLYSLATPDRYFDSINLLSYDYKRESTNGVTLVTANCTFREIRVTGSMVAQTSSASSASTKDAGTVKTSSPTTSQASRMSSSSVT